MLNAIPGDTLFYIIDPSGYDYCSKFRDTFDMKVVYVKASDDLRRTRANVRNGDDTAWAKRTADEDAQFSDFERKEPWDILVENNGTMEAGEQAFIDAIGKL